MPLEKESTRMLAGTGTGTYRLMRILGEGGFGSVWLAEQTAPLRREVALKILKHGMDSEAIVARFETERRVLALLDHPSLSRVLDAGKTPDGLPFFAMEYVRGDPLDTYADSQSLDLRTRVELLIQVCEAVQHAHSKGLVHRDLKPGNILVGPEGKSHRAKVIDFGIAKVLHSAASDDSATMVGQILGTPAYMAPEQASPGAVDVDTRADVYALGVVLYETLTGSLPFPRDLLRTAGMQEWQRQLSDIIPMRPSARVKTRIGSSTPEDTAAFIQQRRDTLNGLFSTMHRDLDWIVMRCLEKNRDRRYASAAALADDLRRYLRGDPVEAGPPTLRYRSSKFVKRYKVAVVTAVTAVGLLITATVFSTLMWTRSETALRRAQATLGTFVGSLSTASPDSGGTTSMAFGEFMNSVEKNAAQSLAEEPSVAATLLHLIGTLRLSAFDHVGAERALSQAVSLRRNDSSNSVSQATLGQSLHDYGRSLYFLKRYEHSRLAYEEALSIWIINVDPSHEAETLLHLGSVYAALVQPDASGKSFDAAIARLTEHHGEIHVDVAGAYFSRGQQALRTGQLEDALADYTNTVEILQRAVKEPEYRLGRALGGLAGLQAKLNQVGASTANYKRSIQNLEATLGAEHPSLLNTKEDFARLLLDWGDAAQASTVLDTVVPPRRRQGDKPTALLRTLELNAIAHLRNSDFNGAVAIANRALDLQRELSPAGGLVTARILLLVANAMMKLNDPQATIMRFIDEAITECERAGEPGAELLKTAHADREILLAMSNTSPPISK